MKGNSPNPNQLNFFYPRLVDMLNPDHELVRLAEEIGWAEIEQKFLHLYQPTGRPSKPIRLMAGMLIMKRLYDLSDEALVEKWVENPYFQYFCGEVIFRWHKPADPSDLSYFRNRIGQEGVLFVLQYKMAFPD